MCQPRCCGSVGLDKPDRDAKMPTVNARVLAILRLLALLLGRYVIHGLLSLLLPPALERTRRAQVHRRNAQSFRRTATELRGVLIKVGQFLSARVDILPDEFTEELAQLQDRVPPVDFAVIRQQLHQELGKDPDLIFSNFAAVPLAAASLGQVHEATLPDGQRVAVKVQYPDIGRIVETDLQALRWGTRLLQWWVPTVRFDLLYQEFSGILRQELDYIHEGRSAEAFRSNFASDERVVVPRVFWEHTTPRVLTLEFVDGIKITNVSELEAKGVQLPALARLLVETYIAQLLRHRLFHGDPHPGNLFVQPHPLGPRLVFVDFGIMQPMGPGLYRAVKRSMKAIIERDMAGIVRGMQELGFVMRTVRSRDVEQVVAFLMSEYRDRPPRELRELTLDDIARDLRELFRVYPYLQLPNHFIILGRTVGMLSGLNAQLDPDLNMIELAAPHVREFLAAEEAAVETVFQKILDWGETLLGLPKLLELHLKSAQREELRSQRSMDDFQPMFDRLTRLVFRGLSAVVAVVAFGFWVWLRDRGDPWAHLLGLAAAAAAAVLLGSFLRRSWRP